MPLFSQPTARTVSIIELLTAHPHQGFGLTEISRRLGLNKATCHSILSTLSSFGFLLQDPMSRLYYLGPSIIAAGNAALGAFPVIDYARHALRSLSEEFDFSFSIIGRSQSHVVLLSTSTPSTPEEPFRLGLRIPYIAPLGATFIAWSPAKTLERWLKECHETVGDYDDAFDQQLRISVICIRSRGYEVNLKTKADEIFFEELKQIRGS